MRWTIALGLLSCGLAACASSDGVDGPELLVASDLDNPPFAWVDDDGVPRGRDVEMMQLLAERLERELVWERLAFDALLPAVELGRVDCACATLGITPERAERVAFSRPYFETTIAVLARAGHGEPTRPDELAGRRVSAGAGTTAERALRARLPHAVPALESKNGASAAERLLAREIDAAVMDAPAARRAAAESAGRLVVLPAPLGVERYAIAVDPSRPELVAAIDAALAELRAGGRLAELNARFELDSP